MANLTLIHNPFDIKDKSVFSIDDGATVYTIISKYIKEYDSKDYDFMFSVNGVITENLGSIIKKDDHLAIVPIPAGGGGGGGKNILSTVAMIALIVVAPQVGFQAQAMLSASYGAAIGATGYMAAYYVGVAATMMIGGMLISSLTPVQTAGNDSISSSDISSVSPTYSFGGGSNARQEGSSIPIIIGKAKIVPPIVSSYLSVDGDNQYINMLMAINDGQFDTVHSIQVNNQDSANYTDITSDIRYGTNTQTVLNKFSDEITTVSDGRALNDTATIVAYETSSNAINELQVCALLGKGLYFIQDSGGYSARTITFDIRYRLLGSGTWITSNKTITGTYKTTKRFVYTFKDLPVGTYEVEIQRTSAFDTNTRVANDLTFEYINEITYDDLTYPNVGLLSIDALATDQLSGGFPQVSAVVENTYLRYWENNAVVTDTNKRLDNPAWATYYILRKANFTDENINIAEFQSWSDFCDTKSYKCNLILDQSMDLPSILNTISPLGRAKVVQVGTKWSPIIDTVVSIPTQSFLFTSGNILDGSFALDYIPYTDRANTVEVTYYDENNDYQATTVQAQSHNFDATADEIKTSINYYGCTTKQMAADYAQFLINNNRYISETVTFTVNIDSIACTIGDVIKVGQQYLTNNIADGRIAEVPDINTLVLDSEFTLETGKTYQIDIRKSDDDTLHTVNVVNSETTTNTVTLIGNSIVFSEFDVFAIGESGFQSNLYRVVNITRAEDFNRKISAIEYVPEVYDDTLIIPDEEVKVLYTVADLRANDNSVKNEDGTISDRLTISWQTRGLNLNQSVYIDGTLVGTSNTNTFIWNSPIRDKTYAIKVGDNTITHTYTGTLIKLDSITNVTSSFANGVIYMSWDKVNDPDLLHYELQVYGRTYRVVDNSLNIIDLDVGTYAVKLYAVNTSKVKSTVTNYSLVVRQPTLMFSIRDSYLIEQAFLDGLMTIYTSTTEPVANQKYDLWKVDADNITVDEWAFNSTALDGVTWESGQDYNLYKYWNGAEWIFCTPDQIAVARRMLGQLTAAGITDNEVHIYSVQPYTPYEINDLWIDGTTIKVCTTTRATGAYVSTDWEVATGKDSINIATKLENVVLTS